MAQMLMAGGAPRAEAEAALRRRMPSPSGSAGTAPTSCRWSDPRRRRSGLGDGVLGRPLELRVGAERDPGPDGCGRHDRPRCPGTRTRRVRWLAGGHDNITVAPGPRRALTGVRGLPLPRAGSAERLQTGNRSRCRPGRHGAGLPRPGFFATFRVGGRLLRARRSSGGRDLLKAEATPPRGTAEEVTRRSWTSSGPRSDCSRARRPSRSRGFKAVVPGPPTRSPMPPKGVAPEESAVIDQVRRALADAEPGPGLR